MQYLIEKLLMGVPAIQREDMAKYLQQLNLIKNVNEWYH